MNNIFIVPLWQLLVGTIIILLMCLWLRHISQLEEKDLKEGEK